MRFLKHLQDTKLSELALLDFAYIVVLLPLVVMLKLPMILFSIIVLAILFFKRTPASDILLFSIFILGGIALYLSLYGAFSFSGLSRLKLFLELLVYVLLIVVSLQRLTRKINFYLLISPFLFLALSLFFYHGIMMLMYVLFEVFVLLWMILSGRMQGDIHEAFKNSMVMFMYSLPWVVVLFIFFPRISFEHASYGFKGESIKRMGHDGTMYLDGNALIVPSDRIVMEVGFEEEIPPANTLYFRGSVLYVDKKDHWEALPKYAKRKEKLYYPTQGKEIRYKVTLYPTNKKWLYLLDMPKRSVENATLDRDLISTVEKNIEEPVHYAAISSLSPSYTETLDNVTYKISTFFDAQQNPQSYELAQTILKKSSSTKEKVDKLMALFKAQSLTYTLKPDALDINHSTDSFLFDKKRGYCVHFASSFVTMARMLGIPARIVTGYKSDKSESLKNYLAIKEKDAHAWAELYIEGKWVRYETTATASSIDFGSIAQAASVQASGEKNPLLQKINLYLMYTKYNIETWILYYSHVRQLQLLEYAKKNPSFVFGFVASFILLVIGSFLVIAYFRRPRYSSEALAMLQPLLSVLKKEGYLKHKEESMHQFLLRVSANYPENKALRNVDRLYEVLCYANTKDTNTYQAFKNNIKKASKAITINFP